MNVVRFDSLCGGLNASDNPTVIDNTKLCDSMNMYADGGVLKSRCGIKSKAMFELSGYEPIGAGMSIETDGQALRILPMKSVSGGNIELKLLIISRSRKYYITVFSEQYTENRIYDAGCLMFADVPSDGCGIYAYASVICNGSVIKSQLYELSSNKSSVAVSDGAYIPTVLINGRGNLYDTLESSEKNLPNPMQGEQMNLLSRGFRAAYNTDGVSLYYSLPKCFLSSDEEINISLKKDSSKTYKFTIGKGSNKSDSRVVNNVEIYAQVNRTMGRVYFYNGETQYALPRGEDVPNNLIVTAYTSVQKGQLGKMKQAQNFGNHTFVYGSADCPEKLYWSHGDKPLYFPENNYVSVGEPLSSVSVLAKQNNLLIVFKAHEIYYISAVKADDYDLESALDGNVSRIKCSQSVNIAQLNGGIGCAYPHTVKLCANRLVFLGSDGNVYALTSTAMSQKQVYRISREILPLIDECNNGCAVSALKSEGRYILILGENLFGFDYNTAAFRSISSNSGGSDSAKGVAWFAYKADGLSGAKYCFDLQDAIISGADGTVKLHEFCGECDDNCGESGQIAWNFATKIVDLHNKSKVSRVIIRFDENTSADNDMNICLITDRGDVKMPIKSLYISNREKAADLRLNLRGVRMLGIYLQGCGYVGVRCIEAVCYGG